MFIFYIFINLVYVIIIFMQLKTKLNIFIGDFLGGINSAIITLPQALAFGVATGFGAGAGLWGAIILCFVAGLVGPRVPLVSGATGPVAIVIAAMMTALGFDIKAAVTIIIMAGLFQILASLTNLPSIVKYVPYPVISGFMNGVGFIIIILQLNPLLGHKSFSSTVDTIINLNNSLCSINYDALIIGCLTLLIVFCIPKRLNKIIPSQILALIICTFISIKMGLNIDRISEVSVAFPSIMIPYFDINKIFEYIPYALVLTVVFSAESLLTGLVSDSIVKTKTSPKHILAAQGIGNIFCGLTASLGGSAATMRTVAALNTGSTTRLTTIINPLILVVLLVYCSEFVAQIPLAVLAGILIKIGADIIDIKLIKVIKYAPKDDLYVLFLVFFLTVFYNLIFAIGAGITLAALLYAKRVADNTKLVHKKVYDIDIMKMERILERDYKHKIRVVHIEGQFFFGSATQLISHFDDILGTEYLIINYDADELLDISAVFALEDIIIRLKSQHIIPILVSNTQVINQLKSLGVIEQIGDKFVFGSETEAIRFAKAKLNITNK